MAGRATGLAQSISEAQAREIVSARRAEPGLSLAAIAKRLGRSVNTIKKYLDLAARDPERFRAVAGERVLSPAQARFRDALLTDWEFIAVHGRGLTIMDFHRSGWEMGERHLESIWEMPRGSGKSEIGCQVRCIQEILRSVEAVRLAGEGQPIPRGWTPNVAIAVISASGGQAERSVAVVREFLERPEVEAIWGSLVGHAWTSSGLFVRQRSIERADPTLCALGIGSKFTTGLHPDLVILDDTVNHENSRTFAARMTVRAWLANTLRGICLPHTRIVWLNTPYHPEDAIASQEDGGVKVFRQPAIVLTTTKDEVSFWPEMFPMESGARADGRAVEGLVQRRAKMERDAPGSFEAQYQMDCSRVVEGRIDPSMIRRVAREAVPQGMRVVQFCDFAWSAGNRSDWTSIATLALDRATARIYILRVRQVKVSPGAIRLVVREEYKTHSPEVVGAEYTGLYAREVQNVMDALADIPWAPVAPRGDKETRALPLHDMIERGMVYAVDEPWWDGFEAQLAIFPHGKNDDMVDAACSALALLRGDSVAVGRGASVDLGGFMAAARGG